MSASASQSPQAAREMALIQIGDAPLQAGAASSIPQFVKMLSWPQGMATEVRRLARKTVPQRPVPVTTYWRFFMAG